MSDTCATCGHERTQGRCWRLTCPTNGSTGEALAMMRKTVTIVAAEMEITVHRMKHCARLGLFDEPD